LYRYARRLSISCLGDWSRLPVANLTAKQNAGPKAGVSTSHSVAFLTVVVPIITVVVTSIMTVVVPIIIVVMTSILAAGVMAVNPLPAVVGPMARDPNHFPVACPITGAMAVIWPVAYLNAEALRRKGSRENDARGRERGEQ
jgi:hypothetical protein